MKTINIIQDVPMPLAAVTHKFAWLGTSGSGKTYGAGRFAEDLWDLKAQFVVFDPVGVWWGLRLDKDGKKPSNIGVPVFGGLHGDIPLEATSGALMADLVVDKNISAVFDVSQFESDADKTRFATAFANRFFFRKKQAPSAVQLLLEECQEFVPQNPQRGEEMMLHAFTRIQKIGRNFGIGMSLITQRPQEVSKKALNLAGTLFVFRTTGSHERKAIELWMKDNSIDEQDIISDLPKLETGSPHVWSPEFLKISKVVKILPKRTFDASATPEIGAARVVRELAHIDLDKIKTDMAATIEKAKGEDPKLLRREISRLTAELAKKLPPREVVATKIQKIEVPTIGKKTLAGLEKIVGQIQKTFTKEKEFYKRAVEVADGILKAADLLSSEIAKAGKPGAIPPAAPGFNVPPPRYTLDTKHRTPAIVEVDSTAPTPEGLTGPEHRVVTAFAKLETNQIPFKLPLIAAFAKYSVKSSGFEKALGLCKSKGLIADNRLTAAGRAVIGEDLFVPVTQLDLHKAIMAVLTGPEQRVLGPLLQVPGGMTDDELAPEAQYSPKSSGYEKARGMLKSKGLIEKEGEVYKAADMLFI